MGSSTTAVASYTISDSIVGARYIDADGETSFDINLAKSRFNTGLNTVSATYAKVGGTEGSKGSAATITYDRTAPSITIQNPNTNAATSKVVSATDNESGTTVWKYKALTDAVQVCTEATMTSGTTDYTEGDDISFTDSTDNGSRICFSSEDAAGNVAYRVSNTINGIDGSAPTVTSAVTTSTDGRTVRVMLSEAVYAAKTPALTDFRVVVSGVEYPIRGITGLSTSASEAKNFFTVTLPSFPSGTQMTMKYTAGTNKITDTIGNELASFTGQTISNMKLISLDLHENDDTGTDTTDDVTTFDGNEVTVTVSLSEGIFSNGDIVRIFMGSKLTPERAYTVSDILRAPTYKDATGEVSFTADLPKSIFVEGLNNLSATYTPSGGDESVRGEMLAITYDRTGPSITVKNPTTVKEARKVVSATDGETTATVWEYKRIAGTAVCDDATMTDASAYTEGSVTAIVLDSEDDNDTKVCFSSTDIAGNTSYTASDKVSGIDTTAPTVSVASITTTTRATTKVTFTEPVYAASAVTPTDFTLVSGATRYTVTSIVGLANNATSATASIVLNHIPISETGTASLQYAKGSVSIVDIAGNALESFTESVANTPFATISLDAQDDTGVSATDGITHIDGNEASFTISLTSGTFTNGDRVQVYEKGKSAALKSVVISPAGTGTVDADGSTSFATTIAKQVFDEGTVTLYAIYTPAGRAASGSGIDYSFTYDKTAPRATVTNPTTTLAPKKQVSAQDGETESTVWTYEVLAGNETCNASVFTVDTTPYTEGSIIEMTENTMNGKKVCFSTTDVAGNSAYIASDILQGIDSDAPTVTSAMIDNFERTRTVIVFSEKVYASAGFSPSDFSIEIGGTGYTQRVTAIENLPTTARAARKTLVLIHPTVSDQITSQVSYTPSTETIRDIAGNTLAAFTQSIDNTSFITLDLADEDDTGISQTDNYTRLDGSTVALNVVLNNNAVFANSDVITIYSGEDREVVRRITISTFPAQDSIDAHGSSTFKVEIPKSTFTSNGTTTLSAGYAPFGNSALNKIGGMLQVTVDTNSPVIKITEPVATPAAQKTVSATSDETTAEEWKYAQIQNDVVCGADDAQVWDDYTKGTTIPFNSEDDNGTKVCFSVADLAGNTAYKGSAEITGIDTKVPTVSTVSVVGENALTVTMSEPVYSVAGPNPNDFVVFVNGAPVITDLISGIPNTVARADTQFTVTVVNAFRASDSVSLSYIGSTRSIDNELIKDSIGNKLAAFDKIAATVPSVLTLSLDPVYDTGTANDDGLTRFGDDAQVGFIATLNKGAFNDGDKVRIYRNSDKKALATITVGIRSGEVNARGETSLTAMVPKKEFVEGTFSLRATYATRTTQEGLPSDAVKITYDVTAPTVSVISPNNDLAKMKVVSASDSEKEATVWTYKQIAGNISCNESTMSSDTKEYTEGMEVSFGEETDNGTRVCFSSTDVAGNTAYGASRLLRNIDTTAPVITVTNPNSDAAQTKVVQASDNESKTTWNYKQIAGDAACDAAAMESGTQTYTERRKDYT